jgi:hypothetical protein
VVVVGNVAVLVVLVVVVVTVSKGLVIAIMLP